MSKYVAKKSTFKTRADWMNSTKWKLSLRSPSVLVRKITHVDFKPSENPIPQTAFKMRQVLESKFLPPEIADDTRGLVFNPRKLAENLCVFIKYDIEGIKLKHINAFSHLSGVPRSVIKGMAELYPVIRHFVELVEAGTTTYVLEKANEDPRYKTFAEFVTKNISGGEFLAKPPEEDKKDTNFVVSIAVQNDVEKIPTNGVEVINVE